MPEEKKRRPRGQVIPLDAGNREKCRTWGVRVPLKERDATGRHKTHYEALYNKTERQAEKRRDQLLAEVEAGLFFSPAPITFNALLDEWLKQKEREKLSPASLDSYRHTTAAFLRPYLGHLQIGEISPVTVRDLFNTLQDRKLADATIRYARTVLNLVMHDAIRWRYLRENPAAGIKPPEGADGRTCRSFDLAETRKLLETASLDPDDLIFVFALLTGLRPAEYTGLLWAHVAEADGRGVVHVRQVAHKLQGGGWVFRRPKTKKSVRSVPFPAALYADLMRWRARLDARRRAVGGEWQDYGLVFPNATGAPQRTDSLGLKFQRLLKRAELPVHFTLYSLRYTFATLQFMAGERDKVISDLMGHAKVDF